MGLPMYELQGHQKQKKRMAIYFTFCERKYGLLISTNIASRGLDFPMIDWVIQFDIPENTETYVHRIGRTARFKYEGKGLTFVS
jgi:ATP-dependent RNA helicase DDX10/DBP4